MSKSKLVSKKCVNFVKSFEGFSPVVYKDCVGVNTLGYGMTGKEIEGLVHVTEVQASQMLEDLLNDKYALPIKKDLDSKKVVLNQNEFDALVSMSYNIGVGGLLSSTLYKNIVKGIRDKNIITSNFQAWSNAGGKRVEGLYRRRTEEAKIFFSKEIVQVVSPTVSQEDIKNGIKFRKELIIIKECNCIDSKGAIAKVFKVNDKVTATDEYFGYWICKLGKFPKICCKEKC